MAYDAAGVFVLNRAVPLRVDGNLIAGMLQLGFDHPLADDPMLRSGKGIIGHVIHTGETRAGARRAPRPALRRGPRARRSRSWPCRS